MPKFVIQKVLTEVNQAGGVEPFNQAQVNGNFANLFFGIGQKKVDESTSTLGAPWVSSTEGRI